MALTDLGARRIVQPEQSPAAEADHPALETLEAEIRMLRTEVVRLRDIVVEREQKGRTLLNAYRDVIADLTNLFEAERRENVKREESLRFFLASIEKRLKEDIRSELGTGGDDGATERSSKRRSLFRRRR